MSSLLLDSINVFSSSVLSLDVRNKSSAVKNRAVQCAAEKLIHSIKDFEDSGNTLDPATLAKYSISLNFARSLYTELKVGGAFWRLFSPSKTAMSIEKALAASDELYERSTFKEGLKEAEADDLLNYFGVGDLLDGAPCEEKQIRVLNTLKIQLKKRGCPERIIEKLLSGLTKVAKNLNKDGIASSFFVDILKTCTKEEETIFVISLACAFCQQRFDKTAAKKTVTSMAEPLEGWNIFELLNVRSIPKEEDTGIDKEVKKNIHNFMRDLRDCIPKEHSHLLNRLDVAMMGRTKFIWGDRDHSIGICYGRSILSVSYSVDHASADEKKARYIQSLYSLAHVTETHPFVETLDKLILPGQVRPLICDHSKALEEASRLLPTISMESLESLDPVLARNWAKCFRFHDTREFFSKVLHDQDVLLPIALRVLGNLSLSRKSHTIAQNKIETLFGIKKIIEKNFAVNELSKAIEYIKSFKEESLLMLKLKGLKPGHAMSIQYTPATDTEKEKYILLDPDNRDGRTGDVKPIVFGDIESLQEGLETLLSGCYKSFDYHTITIAKFDKIAITKNKVSNYINEIELIDKDLAASLTVLLETKDPAAVFTIAQEKIKTKLSGLSDSFKEDLRKAIVELFGIDSETVMNFPEHNLPVLSAAWKKVKAQKLEQLEFFARDDERYDPIRVLAAEAVAMHPALIDPLLKFWKEHQVRIKSSDSSAVIPELTACIERSLREFALKTI